MRRPKSARKEGSGEFKEDAKRRHLDAARLEITHLRIRIVELLELMAERTHGDVAYASLEPRVTPAPGTRSTRSCTGEGL